MGKLGSAAEAPVPRVALLHEPRRRPGHDLGRGVVPHRERRGSQGTAELAPDPLHILAALAVGVVSSAEDGGEAGQAAARHGREVRPTEVRRTPGGEEDGHRPAPPAGHRLDRLHVDGIHVGALLAVDLDVDEELVHQAGDAGILEALVGHHVAPVTGAVADREKDRAVALPGRPQRLFTPRVPIDRVAGVLAEVGAGLRREAVGHAGGSAQLRRRWARPTRPTADEPAASAAHSTMPMSGAHPPPAANATAQTASTMAADAAAMTERR